MGGRLICGLQVYCYMTEGGFVYIGQEVKGTRVQVNSDDSVEIAGRKGVEG